MKKFFGKLLSIFNIRHEAAIKVLSILLAILFWVFVMDKENPVITRVFYNVPVSYVGELGSDLVVSSAPRYYANVEVTGRRNSVLAARSDNISLTVDYSDLVDGSNNAKVEVSNTFTDISVVSLNPSSVNVVLEKIISAEKPVTYYFTSSFDETLKNSSVRVTPTQVVVTGPRSLVASVVELAGYIDAAGISDSMSFELLVVPMNSMGEVVSGVSMSGNTVTAAVSAIRTKTVPIVVDFVDDTDEGYELSGYTLARSEAIISGDPDYVDSVTELRANTIVIKGSDNVTDALTFEQLENVAVSEPELLTYDAEVLKIETTEFVYSVSEMKIIAPTDTLKVSLPESFVTTISLKGFLHEIQDIAKSDFELKVDLSEYGEGVHTVPVDIVAGNHLDTENEHIVFEVTQGAEITLQIESAAETEGEE